MSNCRLQVATEYYLTLEKDVLSKTLELLTFFLLWREDLTRQRNVLLRLVAACFMVTYSAVLQKKCHIEYINCTNKMKNDVLFTC